MPNSLHRTVQEVASCYAACFRPAEVATPAKGFSGAVIARINCAAGTFCLRGWPPDALPADRILGLHALLRHVYQRDVRQVAVPVESTGGSTLVAAYDRRWQLEPWMPGRADFSQNPTPRRLASAMRMLAAWHKAAASFQPPAGAERWFASRSEAPSPAVAERLGRIRHWLSGGLTPLQRSLENDGPGEFRSAAGRIVELFRRTAPAVADKLQAARHVRYPLQPCLRDVWHDHVLFTGDEVTGLIDASACRRENVATDLARLLGSLVGDDRARWSMAVDEYQRDRPLTPKERELIDLLDESQVVLAGLTWLQRRYLTGRPVQHDPRVMRRLQTIVARLERLARHD